MPNRALQVKADRAKTERVMRGITEHMKPDYITASARKPLLREIAAIAATMQPSHVARLTIIEREREMVMYNPRQPEHRKPAMWAAMVACDGELIKKVTR